jgi:hypothetical protein
MVDGYIADESQEGRILRLLEARAGEGWVSALELSAISLQYCARVCGLRQRGIAIESKLEMQNGRRRGFYRIRRPVEQVELISASQMGTRWQDPEERA